MSLKPNRYYLIVWGEEKKPLMYDIIYTTGLTHESPGGLDCIIGNVLFSTLATGRTRAYLRDTPRVKDSIVKSSIMELSKEEAKQEVFKAKLRFPHGTIYND